MHIYLPTQEMKDHWANLADSRRQSFSKFVIEQVTNSLNHEEESPNIDTRVKLIEDRKRLQEENKELLKEIREQDSRIEMLEREARSHVIEPFLEPDFEGVRHYSVKLIDKKQ